MFTETPTNDHREIEQNLENLMESDNIDQGQLESTLKDIQHHMVTEEKHLYPEAEEQFDHQERSEMVEHSYREHTKAKDLVIKLTNDDYDSTHAKRKDIQELYDDLTHHHEEEEQDVFPELEKAMDNKDIQNISSSIRKDLSDTSTFVAQ